jgi:hypothetical protein
LRLAARLTSCYRSPRVEMWYGSSVEIFSSHERTHIFIMRIFRRVLVGMRPCFQTSIHQTDPFFAGRSQNRISFVMRNSNEVLAGSGLVRHVRSLLFDTRHAARVLYDRGRTQKTGFTSGKIIESLDFHLLYFQCCCSRRIADWYPFRWVIVSS